MCFKKGLTNVLEKVENNNIFRGRSQTCYTYKESKSVPQELRQFHIFVELRQFVLEFIGVILNDKHFLLAKSV